MTIDAVKEIAAALTAQHGLTPEDAERFMRLMVDVAGDGLRTDKTVKVKGLGTFKVTAVAARKSVDVNTGAPIVIDARDKITFTPDVQMRDRVNRPFAQFDTVVINDGVDFTAIDEKFAGMTDEDVAASLAIDNDERYAVAQDEAETETIATEAADSQPAPVEAVAAEEETEKEGAADNGEQDATATEPVADEQVEPVAAESVTPEPVAAEPVAPETISPEPVNPETVVAESAAPEPVATEPIVPEPITPEPVAPEAEASELVAPETEPSRGEHRKSYADVMAGKQPHAEAAQPKPSEEMQPSEQPQPSEEMQSQEPQSDESSSISEYDLPRTVYEEWRNDSYVRDVEEEKREQQKREELEAEEEEEEMRTKHRWLRWIMAAVTLLLIIGGAAYYYFGVMQRRDNRRDFLSAIQARRQHPASRPDSLSSKAIANGKRDSAKAAQQVKQLQTAEQLARQAQQASVEKAKAEMKAGGMPDDEVITAAKSAAKKPAEPIAKPAAKTNTKPTADKSKADKNNKEKQATAKPARTNKSAEAAKPKKAEAAKSAKPQPATDYDRDPRVRTGAYRIVGIATTVTVRRGQTLESISRSHLGPGMECYVEAVNGGRKSFRVGDKVNIPALKHKKKAKPKP